MSSEQDLLYPAFQKFYSALSSLERFHKEKNFFENISSLDTFFSEFRNVTFVLQKSLAHTDYMPLYEDLREKYFSELKWFVETRNETTKQHPFELIKKIEITAYMPRGSFEILEKQFSVNDDKPLVSVLDEAKIFLNKINSIEVFFSARFFFYKQGSAENVFTKILQGIKAMSGFLEEFYKQIPNRSQTTEELLNLIIKHPVICIPQDMLLVNDYVYYPAENEFEMVGRWGLSIASSFGGKTLPRTPLKNFNHWYEPLGENNFERFAAMHIAMRIKEEIFPAIMVIFYDDTYEIDAFNSDNKTTLYRKIHETAQQVLNDNVKEVFLEYSMLSIPNKPEILKMYSKDRKKLAEEEWLVLLKVDDQLNEEEYHLFVPGLKCPGYIANEIRAGSNKKLLYGAINMHPIIQAFKQKKAAQTE